MLRDSRFAVESGPRRNEPMTQNTDQKPQRQYVIFNVYSVTDAYHAASPADRARARQELEKIVAELSSRMMVMSYSTIGLKAGADFLLWCVSFDLADFEQLTERLYRSAAAPYFRVRESYLAMTKHSQYVTEHVHEGQEGRRLRIVPGKSPYLFVYPFVKTRAWYALPMQERQRMMNEHIAIGHKYPSVKINTTYAFGLDDHEFVVAFETDSPADFLDLVQELRETEASSYTLRDTPMYTCMRREFSQIMESLS